MRSDQLVLRDIVRTSFAIAVIATATMIVARQHRPLPSYTPAASPVGTARSPVALGAELYERKGCVTCHTVDGSTRIGPTFLHDYGTTIALDDGRTVVMDDAYITESVIYPRAKSRPGYPPAMPSYEGMLKPRELAALTAYIRSLR
jgi:cytochrome c oxidase subunit 2